MMGGSKNFDIKLINFSFGKKAAVWEVTTAMESRRKLARDDVLDAVVRRSHFVNMFLYRYSRFYKIQLKAVVYTIIYTIIF